MSGWLTLGGGMSQWTTMNNHKLKTVQHRPILTNRQQRPLVGLLSELPPTYCQPLNFTRYCCYLLLQSRIWRPTHSNWALATFAQNRYLPRPGHQQITILVVKLLIDIAWLLKMLPQWLTWVSNSRWWIRFIISNGSLQSDTQRNETYPQW